MYYLHDNHADRFVGIADTGPIMTRFIGLTMSRTTTKDVEPTRQADIFPMPLKRRAAAARMIPDNYVLAGLHDLFLLYTLVRILFYLPITCHTVM